jgi:hypothetical protein
MQSLLLQRVLETTDSVLEFTCNLVSLAIRLQFGIAYRLADGLLDRALDFFRRSADRSLSMTTYSCHGDKFRVSTSSLYQDGSAAVDSECT